MAGARLQGNRVHQKGFRILLATQGPRSVGCVLLRPGRVLACVNGGVFQLKRVCSHIKRTIDTTPKTMSSSPEGRGRSPVAGGGDKAKKKKKKKKEGRASSGSDGSRSASPDGRVRGRDREKRKGGSPVRGKANRKVTGPADWTREELLDRIRKFGTFKLDKSTGAGTLESVNRRIMGDDILAIQECFRRYTEVQHVTFSRCFLTDDTFKLICSGFGNLRHLLGRTNDAPWYRYVFSDTPLAFDATPAQPTKTAPLHIPSHE